MDRIVLKMKYTLLILLFLSLNIALSAQVYGFSEGKNLAQLKIAVFNPPVPSTAARFFLEIPYLLRFKTWLRTRRSLFCPSGQRIICLSFAKSNTIGVKIRGSRSNFVWALPIMLTGWKANRVNNGPFEALDRSIFCMIRRAFGRLLISFPQFFIHSIWKRPFDFYLCATILTRR